MSPGTNNRKSSCLWFKPLRITRTWMSLGWSQRSCGGLVNSDEDRTVVLLLLTWWKRSQKPTNPMWQFLVR